ncbi:MAG: dehydratase [Blastococcus sp.]|jgi:3-hydroxybutyryl-CoA dehydratase|nr:dehydratase [Blastococcus sp.]
MTIQQTGRRLRVGETLRTAGRTVETSDIVAFAGLTGDFYPLHVDEEYARTTQFGTRIAHGPLTFSLAVGLVGLSGFYGDAVVALAGIDRLRARRPVKHGDTIHVDLSVVGVSAHSVPDQKFFDVDYDVRNQADERVMTFTMTVLARGDIEASGK